MLQYCGSRWDAVFAKKAFFGSNYVYKFGLWKGGWREQSVPSASTPLTRPPLIFPLRLRPPPHLPLRLDAQWFFPSDSAPSASTPLTQPPFILPLRLRPLHTGSMGCRSAVMLLHHTFHAHSYAAFHVNADHFSRFHDKVFFHLPTVLRIWDVYSRSRIWFFHPRSRVDKIPDPDTHQRM